MSLRYNVIIEKEENLYVARCIDNNVASQGETVELALSNLREAIELYYQDEEPVAPKDVFMTTLEVVV